MTFTKKYLLIFIIGLLCYVPFMLWSENSWFDETFSLYILGYSWTDMFEIITKEDGHPPLYYIILRLWMSGTDFHNIAWARRLGLVYLSLTALLGAFPVRRLCGEKVALMFTALIFFFPTFIYLTTDMRMYGLVAFETTAAFVYTLLIARDNKLSDWLKLGFISICLLYTHYYGGFILTVLYAFLFFNVIAHFKTQKGMLLRFIGISFIVAVSFIPWFTCVFLTQTAHMYRDWYPNADHIITAFSQMIIVDPRIAQDALSALLVSLCSGILWTLLIQNLIERKHHEKIVFLSFLLYFGVIVLTMIISLIMRPMLHARYIEPFAGTLMLGISFILTQESRFKKLFLTFVGACFIVCTINRASDIYFPFHKFLKENIHQKANPNDSVILCDGAHSCMILAFYLPEYKFRFIRPYGTRALLIPERLFFENQMSYDELRKKKLYMFVENVKDMYISATDPYQPFVHFRFKKLEPAEIDILLSEKPDFPA